MYKIRNMTNLFKNNILNNSKNLKNLAIKIENCIISNSYRYNTSSRMLKKYIDDCRDSILAPTDCLRTDHFLNLIYNKILNFKRKNSKTSKEDLERVFDNNFFDELFQKIGCPYFLPIDIQKHLIKFLSARDKITYTSSTKSFKHHLSTGLNRCIDFKKSEELNILKSLEALRYNTCISVSVLNLPKKFLSVLVENVAMNVNIIRLELQDCELLEDMSEFGKLNNILFLKIVNDKTSEIYVGNKFLEIILKLKKIKYFFVSCVKLPNDIIKLKKLEANLKRKRFKFETSYGTGKISIEARANQLIKLYALY